MKKIKSYRDLEYQMEIEKIRREVELDKLKRSMQKTKNSLVPSLISFGLGLFLKKSKRRKS